MAKVAVKPMTKSEVATYLSENVEGMNKKQVVTFLQALADLAYKQAKNTFTIPGLGKLKMVDRKARMGRNPATGEPMQIKAKKSVKFSVSKIAKDAILGVKK